MEEETTVSDEALLGSTKSVPALQRDLVRKIRLQRGVHAVLEGRAKNVVIPLKAFAVTASAVIALLALIDPRALTWLGIDLSPVGRTTTVGVIGFVLFLTTVVTEVLGVRERHQLHREAVQLYSDLLRDMRGLHMEDETEDQRRMLLVQLNERYAQISSSVIDITDRSFERARAAYLRRMATRLAIKEDPFAWPWDRRRLAKTKLANWRDSEGML